MKGIHHEQGLKGDLGYMVVLHLLCD